MVSARIGKGASTYNVREATDGVERVNNNVEIPSATASTSSDDVDKW